MRPFDGLEDASLLPMYIILLLHTCAALLAASVGASTLKPPVLPLIVRNPYLSTWLTDARDVPWSKWPIFWTGQEVQSMICLCHGDLHANAPIKQVGMSMLALVPDSKTVYPLLGRPQDSLDPEGHEAG